MTADNLDGVFVGAHGAVRTQAIELAFFRAGLHYGNLFLYREALESYIVHNSYGKVTLGRLELQVLIYGDDLRRSGVLAGKSIASSND